MKFKNLLFLALVAGVPLPQADAQHAGFAVGIQRPIINPPVAPMLNPPVTPMGQPPFHSGFPNFGVTPHIKPPIISTFPSAQFPSQVPIKQFPNVPSFVGPHGGRPGGPIGPNGPGYGNPGYGGAYGGYGTPFGGNGGYGGYYGNGAPYGGANGSLYGGVYGATVVVPENATVVTNSTVIILPQPPGQVVRVGPNMAPVTVTGNGINYQDSLVGMTRDQVIQRFGSPISGVYTQSGELLAFSGGMTVVIQNGKVVRPN
jgi:hypothetical protein